MLLAVRGGPPSRGRPRVVSWPATHLLAGRPAIWSWRAGRPGSSRGGQRSKGLELRVSGRNPPTYSRGGHIAVRYMLPSRVGVLETI